MSISSGKNLRVIAWIVFELLISLLQLGDSCAIFHDKNMYPVSMKLFVQCYGGMMNLRKI